MPATLPADQFDARSNLCEGTTIQAAEKLETEGAGGFNPRIRPAKSARALALEGCFPQIPLGISVFPQPL